MTASHSIPLLTTLAFDDYATQSSRPLLVAVSTSANSEDQELLCLLAEMIPHGDGRMAVVRRRLAPARFCASYAAIFCRNSNFTLMTGLPSHWLNWPDCLWRS
jgi:hypothetical protein